MNDNREAAMVLVDNGLVSEREMLLACLRYMSQDEVGHMLEVEEFLEDQED